MKCLADFVVRSELAVSEPDQQLRLHHQSGEFELRIANIASSAENEAHNLSVYLIFDAPNLATAKDIALQHIIEAMNALTMVTGFRFEYVRLIKVIDWTPGVSTRQARVFETFDPDAYPQRILNHEYLESVAKILSLKLQPEAKRAMRWFRLGVGGESADEIFQFFWFALEITASLLKPTEKVNDRCSTCHGPLYCEKCDEYPTHRPYPKQAIRALVEKIVRSHDRDVFADLDTARNALMHGLDLIDVETELGVNSGYLVDILGNVTREALFLLLPADVVDESFLLAIPSTYVKEHIVLAATILCHLTEGPDGEPNLSDFSSPKISLIPIKQDESDS